MNLRTIILLVSLAALSYSCQKKSKYVLGELIEIQYYDTLKSGEWISIDEAKWEHFDTYVEPAEDSVISMDIEEFYKLPTSIRNTKIPQVNDNVFKRTYNNPDMAFELLRRLSSIKDDDGNQVYKMVGHALQLARGKMALTRFDGKPIKVMTSEGYGAEVKKIN